MPADRHRAPPMPLLAATLPACLELLAGIEDRGHTFLTANGAQHRSFADTMRRAAVVQQALEGSGLRRGERVLCAIADNAAFVVTFLAALRGGIVPVPVAPPPDSAAGVAPERLLRIATASGAAAIICAQRDHHLFAQSPALPEVRHVLPYEELLAAELPPASPASLSGDDLGLLQFTSGSTGHPKGVQVRHRHLAANARFILQEALRLDTSDTVVSWLPLHHDMGLIGKLLAPLFFACPTVFIPTQRFIRSPRVWMETISRHRGTITFGPNFALELMTRVTSEAAIATLDLSALRVLGCGAEPISADVLRRTGALLAKAGMPPEALLPCYGMAEATLAISFADLTTPPRSVRIDRRTYERQGKIERIASSDDRPAMELVGCGRTSGEQELAIVDERGDVVPQATLGEVTVRGPGVAEGSSAAPPADSPSDAHVDRQGWLHTGDLGFLLDGELYISGRKKDLVIVRGQNFFPQDLEEIVGSVPGVRPGAVVALAVPGTATEALVLVIEVRANIDAGELRRSVANRLAARAGVVADRIVLVEPNALPRTTSGKLQRSLTKQLLLDERLTLAARTTNPTPS